MSSTDNVPFFKKKKGARPTTARKRSASPDHSDLNGGSSTLKSQVVLPNKKAASNLLSAGTKRTASQREGIDEPEKDGPDVKWTAEGSHVNAALDILAGDEAEELLAKRRRKERLDAGVLDVEVPDDGQYHGQAAYRTLIKKTTETPKAMRVGPQRSTNTIRTVTITDYQPDVCKDYKGKHARDALLNSLSDTLYKKPVIVDSVIHVNFSTIAELVSSLLDLRVHGLWNSIIPL